MMIERTLIFLIFLVGFWAIIANKHIIKKIFGLNIINAAVVLLFILEGSRIGTQAPLLDMQVTNIVDPIPQALMLTAIVISVCVSALALALSVRLFKATGSFDIDVIQERLSHEQ